MFFILVHVTFHQMHALAEVRHLSHSSKSFLTGCMQYWLKYHWLQVCPAHQLSISNSTILRNDYISLLSDLCACVHVKKQV